MARKDYKSDPEYIEALAELRKHMRPGTTVYTVLRSRSRSGMYRTLDVFTIEKGQPMRWTWSVAKVLRARYDRRTEALGVGGCGMDMGYHIVNSLSYALHGMKPKGDGAKPENAGRPFTPRRGHYRAGYSLEHRWL